jgi:hypothetical protein
VLLHLIFASTRGPSIGPPSRCPTPGCPGTAFWLHQEVVKPLRDTDLRTIAARRYGCYRCGHTFRVYPSGITSSQTSELVKALSVLFYHLGLSYGAASGILDALGLHQSKTQVYYSVRDAVGRAPDLPRRPVFQGTRRPAGDGACPLVGFDGRWLPIRLSENSLSRLIMTVAAEHRDAQTLTERIAPVAAAVGAELQLDGGPSDDGPPRDPPARTSAAARRLLNRVDGLMAALALETSAERDDSLATIGVCAPRALEDLERVREMLADPRPFHRDELRAMHERYMGAAPPSKGARAGAAYRLRILVLDCWGSLADPSPRPAQTCRKGGYDRKIDSSDP